MKTASKVILGLYFSVLCSESFIIPGTNYCGIGAVEQKDDLLGPFHPRTDNCCRHHDSCPVTITTFSKKFELRNYYLSTISLCQCDEAFRSCLKHDGSQMSMKIGKWYFNDLSIPCFELKEAMVCKQKTWWGRCIKEEKGLKAELKYARKF